jgi:SAM-dependent methyltransferase
MRTAELAPGTLLQQMYLNERIARLGLRPGRFVDIGAGAGQVSSVLLRRGWNGVGIDLNPSACSRNESTNAQYVSSGSYDVRCGDFLSTSDQGSADLVISSMVLEHLDEGAVDQFFGVARQLLAPTSSLIVMVPGSPRHWGIEDDIAGHVRRFDKATLVATLQDHGFEADHVAGLTYPISNVLLPISNMIVKRAEHHRLNLSASERTVLAGDRRVMFKTSYPAPLGWVMNRFTMLPFHALQKAFRDNPKSLVLYAEARPR